MAAFSRREPDRLPDLTAAALKAIRQIDQRTASDTETLVVGFLWTAWPTREAQNQ